MRLDQFILAVLSFCFAMTCSIMLYGNIIENYTLNTTIDAEGANFSSVYQKVDEIYDTSQDVKEEALGTEIVGGATAWDSMITGGYKAIKLVYNSFDIVGDIIDAVIRELGLPPFVGTYAVMALLFTLLFSVMFMIFRFKG